MPKVDGSIIIRRPACEVFAYATSAESHLRWVPGIRDAAFLDDEPLHRGSRWRVTVAFGGINVDAVNEVVDLVPNRLFAWRSVGGVVTSSGSYSFTPLGSGATRFDYEFVSEDRLAALVGGFAMPVAVRLLRREIRGRLQGIKASLEAGEFAAA